MAAAYHNLGLAYGEKKGYKQALSNLEKAIQIQPAIFAENQKLIAALGNNVEQIVDSQPNPTLTVPPSFMLPADSWEPDNSCINATTLVVNGAIQEHNLTPTKEGTHDIDWMKIETIQGHTYTVEVKSFSSNNNLYAESYTFCVGQASLNADIRSKIESDKKVRLSVQHRPLTEVDFRATHPWIPNSSLSTQRTQSTVTLLRFDSAVEQYIPSSLHNTQFMNADIRVKFELTPSKRRSTQYNQPSGPGYRFSIESDQNRPYYVNIKNDQSVHGIDTRYRIWVTADVIEPPSLVCTGIITSSTIEDYKNSVDCINGYVYLDGIPTNKAEIILTSSSGTTKTISTYEDSAGLPYFSVSLQDGPLDIRVGDPVTLTANYGKQTTSESFIAREAKGMQIDLVLPSDNIDIAPIATINFVSSKEVRRSEIITFEGSGGDGDRTDVIVAYEWRVDNHIISTEPIFTINAAEFPAGVQTIIYRVQDDEGNWSLPQTQDIRVTEDNGSF